MLSKKGRIGVALLIVMSCSIATISYGGAFSKEKAGTTGAQFLKIGCGSRAIGMGEAYSAVADEVSAIYWNPAGLQEIRSKQMSAMHAKWLESINYDFIAYAQPLMGGTIGASVNYLSMTKIEKLDIYGDKEGTFSPYDIAVNVAYARKVGPVACGINTKMIKQELDDKAATGYAVDLGAMYRVNEKMKTALVVQNIGTEIKFVEKSDPLPLNIRIGISCKATDTLLLALDGGVPIDNDPNIHVGCEYTVKAIKNFPIICRMGYKTTTTSDLDAMSGLSGGLGLNIRGIDIDYAWVPYGDLGDTHRLSVGMKFGVKKRLTKKEKIAKMKKHYLKGVKLYKEGQYKQAIIEIEEVLKLEPEHRQSNQLRKKAKSKLLEISRAK